MNGPQFNDARLESPELERHEGLRGLAMAGARIRRVAATRPDTHHTDADRPRGVVAMGAEARLVRAVLEPACPVPFMAWSGPGLPAWVGPLDLAVILGGNDTPGWIVECAAEAKRRGAALIVAAPEDSELARVTASSATTLISLEERDGAVAAAVSALGVLGELGLGPVINPEMVADAADLVAEACSPRRDLAQNPGKELALAVADGLPLIWGGTTLAARASRRIAEALRRACGRPALAADADEIRTLLLAAEPRDPFADPFEQQPGSQPMLVLLDDDKLPERLSSVATGLAEVAESRGQRVVRVSSGEPELGGSDVESYITLLQKGLFGAAYLEIGLTPEQ